MSEQSEQARNLGPREPGEEYKSRGKINQPKGRFEDLFRASKSNKEHGKPSNTEKPPESERFGQMTPSRTETPSDD